MKPLFLTQEEVHSTSKPFGIPNENKLKISASNVESSSEELRKSSMGARATDSARVMKFTKVLSETMVKLGILTSVFLFLILYHLLSYSSLLFYGHFSY